MVGVRTKILITILLLINFPSLANAETETISQKQSKVYCDEKSYILFKSETVKEDTIVTCQRVNEDQYEIKATDIATGEKREIFRKEPEIYLYKDDQSNYDSIFFHNRKEWITLQTENEKEYIKGNLNKTGILKLGIKNTSTQTTDYYKLAAIMIILLSLGYVLFCLMIKIEKSSLKLLIAFLLPSCLFFTGCSSDNPEYDKMVLNHQKHYSQALIHLKSSVQNYNLKEYKVSLDQTSECISNLQASKEINNQMLQYAKDKNIDWLVNYKQLFLQIEDLRIKQCQIIAKADNYQLEKKYDSAKEELANFANLNSKYDKMFSALSDIVDRHPEVFK